MRQEIPQLAGRFVSMLQFRPDVEIYLEQVPPSPVPPGWGLRGLDQYVVAFSSCFVTPAGGERERIEAPDREEYFRYMVEEGAPRLGFICDGVVEQAYVVNDGDLYVELDTGLIHVPPSGVGEAWQIRGTDGFYSVSPPGGRWL